MIMATTKRAIVPREYAESIGVSEDKVLGWINSGELRAINIAQNANGKKPRWRIPLDEIERFEEGRSNAPPEPKAEKPKRRRRGAVAEGPF